MNTLHTFIDHQRLIMHPGSHHQCLRLPKVHQSNCHNYGNPGKKDCQYFPERKKGRGLTDILVNCLNTSCQCSFALEKKHNYTIEIDTELELISVLTSTILFFLRFFYFRTYTYTLLLSLLFLQFNVSFFFFLYLFTICLF